MNLIPGIAKALGVEIGEKFYVRDKKGRYYIVRDEKIQFYFDDHALRGFDRTSCNATLQRLLNGDYEVVKKKWKPKEGDTYWRILFSNVDESFWNGDTIDLTYYAAGNCFKTKKEALENSKSFIEKLQSKYEKES